MSTSRRLLKEKNIARRCLEKAVEQEIDEFVQHRNRDCFDDLNDEIHEYDPDELSIWDYVDDGGIDDFDSQYEQQYWDDCRWFEEQEQWRRLDDDYELDSDYWDQESKKLNSAEYQKWIVGTHYKDHANRTYLCCMVNYVKVMINVHTGLPMSDKENLQLKRVG